MIVLQLGLFVLGCCITSHAFSPDLKVFHQPRNLAFCMHNYHQKQGRESRFIHNMASSDNNDQPLGIGFLGLGIMGQGMAARLISQNIAGNDSTPPLIIWNRTGSKCEDLKKQFPDANIVIKSSPQQVMATCSVVYSMLSTPAVSRQVFYDQGVLEGAHSKTALVDCATLAESDMVEMAKAVEGKGGRFLEAPVSGSKVPAAQGSLIFLCAGSKELFDEIETTGLAAMGKASHFFSTSVGFGTRAKLIVNSLMGTMMTAFGEALSLTEASGLDGDTMLQVLSQGAIASPMYALKGPKMLKSDHAPNFPLQHAHKDMKLAVDMADEYGVEYSVMKEAEKIFDTARNKEDLGDEDFSAVYETIQKAKKKKEE